ncbi:hypothetical protein GUJ93_ZPchr0007g3980 [Zizania palustris]|uniref:Uncharacterized protein n=1 Tax=Zizania palustris TaxID=103762 RepID=A0A8J5W584_ZIZPA|nr:hypothetical protein GUJ93_ZPchr0007g3980 [Zizania palustris]
MQNAEECRTPGERSRTEECSVLTPARRRELQNQDARRRLRRREQRVRRAPAEGAARLRRREQRVRRALRRE